METKFKYGDIVKIKGTEIKGKIVNVNEWRAPATKYAVEVKGAEDYIFAGEKDLILVEV